MSRNPPCSHGRNFPMPVRVSKRGGKFRVVEALTGRIAGGSSPKDGGGHASQAKAKRQARAINEGLRKRT